MRVLVLTVLLAALTLVAAWPAAAGPEYGVQLLVHDPSMNVIGVLERHPWFGLMTVGEMTIPRVSFAGALLGVKANEALVIVGNQFVQLNTSTLQGTFLKCSGLEGRPVGIPAGSVAQGATVAVVAMAPAGSKGDSDPGTRVMVYDSGRGAVRVLAESARRPWLSPDGSQVAYEKLGSGAGVYVAPVAGGKPQKLGAYASVWGWNRNNQIVVSQPSKGRNLWYLVKPDGSIVKPLFENMTGFQPSWPVMHPDGHEVLFLEGEVLYTTPVDGSDPVQVYRNVPQRPLLAYRWVPTQ